ncbi:hypothetical protein PR048_022584 [Dryococelus australis]|uniref:Uncharacterized protein n=1 Tax=Dryococelus australis TaxID=614101 RepID=A0ABQ9H1F4_9NEOP|nr:hypothetical protein PR048_022584 [Dryococelus australis]
MIKRDSPRQHATCNGWRDDNLRQRKVIEVSESNEDAKVVLFKLGGPTTTFSLSKSDVWVKIDSIFDILSPLEFTVVTGRARYVSQKKITRIRHKTVLTEGLVSFVIAGFEATQAPLSPDGSPGLLAEDDRRTRRRGSQLQRWSICFGTSQIFALSQLTGSGNSNVVSIEQRGATRFPKGDISEATRAVLPILSSPELSRYQRDCCVRLVAFPFRDKARSGLVTRERCHVGSEPGEQDLRLRAFGLDSETMNDLEPK